MSDIEKRTRRRTRKALIATGIPLAAAYLGLGIWSGGIYGIFAAIGMYIAMRTVDLINEDPAS